MAQDDNKKIVVEMNKRLEKYFQGGEMAPVLELIDPNGSISTPGMPTNVEGLKQVLPAFQTAFSNFEMQTHNMIAEGDYVAYRTEWTATHTGELMGIPASGKQVRVTETHLDKVINGKVVEHTGDWDQMGLMQQIGAIPVQS